MILDVCGPSVMSSFSRRSRRFASAPIRLHTVNLFSPHQSVVLVGHSHYFREMLRHFRAPGCEAFDTAGEAIRTEDLEKKKLSNAGVAKCTLTFDDAKAVGTPLTSVELLFETKLVD